MEHDGSIFHSGCAVGADFLFSAKEVESVARQSGPNSSFLCMRGGQWTIYDEHGAWPAVGMATVRPEGGLRTVVAVGPAGQYWEVAPLSMQESMGFIAGADQSVRGVRSIADDFFLVGMGRLVMQRVDVGQWQPIGPQPGHPPGQIVGFEDIGGFSSDELYAAGWQGEIWCRDRNRWLQLDSPVSANFNAIACIPDGMVYIAGDAGVMVRGRQDSWMVMDTGRSENLLDVAVHNGQVYVVTDFGILRLVDDKLIPESDFVEEDRPSTCLHLLGCPDGLFSMGPSDLFRLTDGPWERLV